MQYLPGFVTTLKEADCFKTYEDWLRESWQDTDRVGNISVAFAGLYNTGGKKELFLLYVSEYVWRVEGPAALNGMQQRKSGSRSHLISQRFSTWSSCVVLRKVCCVHFARKLRQEAFAQMLYVCLCRTLIEHTKALDPTRPVTYITDSNYAKDKGVGACRTHFTVDTLFLFHFYSRVYHLIGRRLFFCSNSWVPAFFAAEAEKSFIWKNIPHHANLVLLFMWVKNGASAERKGVGFASSRDWCSLLISLSVHVVANNSLLSILCLHTWTTL